MSDNKPLQQTMNKYQPVKLQKVHYNPYGCSYSTPPQKPIHTQPTTQHKTQTKIVQPLNNPQLTPSPIPPKEKSIRMGYINANGIKTHNSNRYKEILQYIQFHKCDIFGITETNINWKNKEIYRRLMKEAKYHTKYPNTTIIPSDAAVEWDQQYNPGGTGTIVTEKCATIIASKESDQQLGRWSLVMIGPPNYQIVIITAYIVNNTPIEPNKNKKAAYQQ